MGVQLPPVPDAHPVYAGLAGAPRSVLHSCGPTRVAARRGRSGVPGSGTPTRLADQGGFSAHLSFVTVSMRVMNAGDGYKYLLRSVAAGDGNRSLSTPLTRYYAETGTPPGYWLGTGVHAFGAGELAQGETVTEAQLAALLGAGLDPVTGDPLGRAYPAYTSIPDRVAARIGELPADLSAEERDARVDQIKAEEETKGSRQAVAGFDFTFSVPKSMSVLWGITDADTQAMIVEAHHAAIAQVVAFLEREVAATRAGVASGDGAVAQVDVVGIAATAYDHWDSRCGDPQLHTHVVVSNKVKTVMDGRWRSLDSRPIHAAVVALSEHYNAVLADRMTGTFGVEWQQRQRGEDRNPSWEITGVADELIGEFSSRSRAIEIEKDRLIAEYVTRRGRKPSRATVIRLRAQATLATRPEKQVRSLADLSTEWRGRAGRILGAAATDWARSLVTDAPHQVSHASDVPLDLTSAVGARVTGIVSQKRATWRHWNCATIIEHGGPGWLNLLVLVFIWDALKFAAMAPIGLVLLAKVRLAEHRQRRSSHHVPMGYAAGRDAEPMTARLQETR